MQPILLSPQQQDVVALEGNVLVTACPGSGKTRVLVAKVIATLDQLETRWQKIAALTYTSRAADEVASRIRDQGSDETQLWTGTVHAFALEWILRPYGCYKPELRNGFAVADEFFIRRTVDSLKSKYSKRPFDDICTSIDRSGNLLAVDAMERALVNEYREILAQCGFIDFDLVLFYAYEILSGNPEIAMTLGSIFKLLCLDEYQDTQDLQYAILSSIVKASHEPVTVFIVGDCNQAIYTSLGSRALSAHEICTDFGLTQLHQTDLSGNYRSTQRIVDFCHNFGDKKAVVESLAAHASEPGMITFDDQVVHRDELASEIAKVVQYHLISGVKESEICILAPIWEFAIAIGRKLSSLLPEVSFDAPGLSPIKFQNDCSWFKLARLFLTEPSPSRYNSRIRWAGDFVKSLELEIGGELPTELRSPRAMLRLCNAIQSSESGGLDFLDDVFAQFMSILSVSRETHPLFFDARQDFFDGAQARLDRDQNIPHDLSSMRRMFQYPSGVVVNSCHGVKGEEFDVVICFGILKGRIPHWSRIFDRTVDHSLDAQRMLYVICSRARKCLHLFAESGRFQRNGQAYETTEQLKNLRFHYDDLKSVV